MTDDVMAQLMAVQALPRGERMARQIELGDAAVVHVGDVIPLWEHLFDKSRTFRALDHAFALELDVDTPHCVPLREHANRWRAYAAPLRKAREERMRLRTALTRYGQHDNTCALLGTLRFGKVMPCDCGFNAAKGTR